jgi:hypothetical protein
VAPLGPLQTAPAHTGNGAMHASNDATASNLRRGTALAEATVAEDEPVPLPFASSDATTTWLMERFHTRL